MSRTRNAYEQLRRDLLAGRWLPGTMLSTYALAEELGVSRTPVIDALRRLESEGLVEIVPQVGCRVVQSTTDELIETLRIRAALEGLAAESAAQQITEHELRALAATLRDGEAAAQRRDATAYEAADRAFHGAIVKASRSPQLEKVVGNVWLWDRHQVDRVRFLASRLRDSAKEHRRIFEALSARDSQGARRLLEDHLRASAADFEAFARSEAAEPSLRRERHQASA